MLTCRCLYQTRIFHWVTNDRICSPLYADSRRQAAAKSARPGFELTTWSGVSWTYRNVQNTRSLDTTLIGECSNIHQHFCTLVQQFVVDCGKLHEDRNQKCLNCFDSQMTAGVSLHLWSASILPPQDETGPSLKSYKNFRSRILPKSFRNLGKLDAEDTSGVVSLSVWLYVLYTVYLWRLTGQVSHWFLSLVRSLGLYQKVFRQFIWICSLHSLNHMLRTIVIFPVRVLNALL